MLIGCFHVQFKVVALLNDSVGTLAGACYEDPNAKVGVILGTGTNACYVEQVAKIGTLAKGATSRPRMVVNTEWGNFTAASLPITQACPMDFSVVLGWSINFCRSEYGIFQSLPSHRYLPGWKQFLCRSHVFQVSSLSLGMRSDELHRRLLTKKATLEHAVILYREFVNDREAHTAK